MWMRKMDYKESWVPKNWCFWTVVLEKTLESPLDSKEIQPVHPKGNQSWIFIERTDTEAETPILGPPDAMNWLIWKDPDAGEDWRQETGTTKDEMVGWHHQLDGHEFEQVPGVSVGQGSLARCNPWYHKESDMTERLNWTERHDQRTLWINFRSSNAGNNSVYICFMICIWQIVSYTKCLTHCCCPFCLKEHVKEWTLADWPCDK